MKSILLAVAIISAFATVGIAQPRPIERTSSPSTGAKAQVAAYIQAKYEGGMFGFDQRETGQLRFDDLNKRMVFYGEDGKEKFSIPFAAMIVIYPQSKSVTSSTGNVVSHIPLPGAALASFIKEKRRYLIMQIKDPDADVSGVVDFKLANKETLDAVLTAIAEKAKLEQRGDAYYKPKFVKSNT